MLFIYSQLKAANPDYFCNKRKRVFQSYHNSYHPQCKHRHPSIPPGKKLISSQPVIPPKTKPKNQTTQMSMIPRRPKNPCPPDPIPYRKPLYLASFPKNPLMFSFHPDFLLFLIPYVDTSVLLSHSLDPLRISCGTYRTSKLVRTSSRNNLRRSRLLRSNAEMLLVRIPNCYVYM